MEFEGDSSYDEMDLIPHKKRQVRMIIKCMEVLKHQAENIMEEIKSLESVSNTMWLEGEKEPDTTFKLINTTKLKPIKYISKVKLRKLKPFLEFHDCTCGEYKEMFVVKEGACVCGIIPEHMHCNNCGGIKIQE